MSQDWLGLGPGLGLVETGGIIRRGITPSAYNGVAGIDQLHLA